MIIIAPPAISNLVCCPRCFPKTSKTTFSSNSQPRGGIFFALPTVIKTKHHKTTHHKPKGGNSIKASTQLRQASLIRVRPARESIVLLGTDGAGKSTAIAELADQLRLAKVPVQCLANASGRRWLSRRADALGITFPTLTQDLIEAVLRTINVAINSLRASSFDGVSLMDRHLYCQLVLRQVRGMPLGLAMPWLARRSVKHAQVVVLDIAAEVAFARIEARGEDSESFEYLSSSREEYLRLARMNGWHVIDASQSTSRVVAELQALLGK